MRAKRESLFHWIINPQVIYSSFIGADFTVDTTAYRADTTAHTSDSITI